MKIFGEPFFNEPMFDKSIEEEKPKEKIVQLAKDVGYFGALVAEDAEVIKNQVIGFLYTGTGGEIKTEIKAEASGIIKEILPEYKTRYDIPGAVEYGQPLFVIEKGGGASSTKTTK